MSNLIDSFPKFSFCVEVSADFAEFTSKKDERTSYQVPTSGALRGMLESVFWKPAIRYIVRKVEVLEPINYVGIKKNELKKYSFSKDVINDNDNRIQRNNSYLRNVRYRVYADIVFIPQEYRKSFCHKGKEMEYHDGENPRKYFEILKRRVEKGQHRYSPYLGTRDCVCNEIEWIDENSPKAEPIDKSIDLGMMYVDYLYQEDYTQDERKMMAGFFQKETGKKFDLKESEWQPRPVVARMKMEHGVVEYPSKYDLKDEMLERMSEFFKG